MEYISLNSFQFFLDILYESGKTSMWTGTWLAGSNAGFSLFNQNNSETKTPQKPKAYFS